MCLNFALLMTLPIRKTEAIFGHEHVHIRVHIPRVVDEIHHKEKVPTRKLPIPIPYSSYEEILHNEEHEPYESPPSHDVFTTSSGTTNDDYYVTTNDEKSFTSGQEENNNFLENDYKDHINRNRYSYHGSFDGNNGIDHVLSPSQRAANENRPTINTLFTLRGDDDYKSEKNDPSYDMMIGNRYRWPAINDFGSTGTGIENWKK